MPTVTEIIYFACCLSHIQLVFKSTSCSHSSFPISVVKFLNFLKVVLLPNTLLVLFITVLSCPYFNPKSNNFHHILHSNSHSHSMCTNSELWPELYWYFPLFKVPFHKSHLWILDFVRNVGKIQEKKANQI